MGDTRKQNAFSRLLLTTRQTSVNASYTSFHHFIPLRLQQDYTHRSLLRFTLAHPPTRSLTRPLARSLAHPCTLSPSGVTTSTFAVWPYKINNLFCLDPLRTDSTQGSLMHERFGQ